MRFRTWIFIAAVFAAPAAFAQAVAEQPAASAAASAGMMYIISGYAGALGGVPNNVLLVFSIDAI